MSKATAYGYELDDSEFRELLDNVTGDTLKRRVANAAKKALKVVQTRAEANFRSLNNQQTKGRKGRFTGGFSAGGKGLPVMVSKSFYKRTSNPFAVLTLRTKSQKTDFRGWFFEAGTKERYLQDRVRIGGRTYRRNKENKAGNGFIGRGRILPGKYLGRAVEATKGQAADEMKQEVIKAIDKTIH